MAERGAIVQSASGATRVRLQVVALLCGLSFLTYYDRQCIVRAQEGIQQSLALSDEQMGLVFGARWLAYALFEIPGGWMGERFGSRATLTRIVLAWSLFTAWRSSNRNGRRPGRCFAAAWRAWWAAC